MNDTAPEPRLVRLVTRHFNDLQGLRVACVTPIVFATAWAWLATGRELLVWVAALAGIVIELALLRRVARFYVRLGRVRMSRRENPDPMWFGAAIGVSFVFVVLKELQRFVMTGAPSLWVLLFSLYPLWRAADGWPLRWWHLATFASMVYVAFGRTAVAHPTDYAWMAPRLWAFGAALLVAGLADHFLLLRTLRTTRDALEEPAS